MTPAQFREALARLSLTQAEAARRMGVTPAAVTRWLSGARPIPKYAVELLSAWEKLANLGRALLQEWAEQRKARGYPE